MLLLLGLAGGVGCRSRPSSSPDTLYRSARAEFVRGQLDRAEKMASAGREKFARSDGTWALRFAVLQADALSYQGRSQEVVDLLRVQNAAVTEVDLQIKRRLLLSLALARLGNAELADSELQAARKSADASGSPLLAEVLRTEGLLENRRGEQSAAAASFRASLELAKKQGDAFLEAADELNLGRVALQAEHIDEAQDWFRVSGRKAEAIHADAIAQNDLGNVGWTSYALGDFDGALESFERAGKQAKSLGSFDNEVLWMQSAGLCLYRMDDLSRAQARYEEALRVATKRQNAAQAAETQTSLGLLFLQQGKLSEAQAQADAAVRGAHAIGDHAKEMDALLLRGLITARGPDLQAGELALAELNAQAEKLPSLRWQIENAYAGMYSRRNNHTKAGAWFQKSIRTFEQQRASVQDDESRLPFSANGDALYREYAEFLLSTGKPAEALRVLDDARARTLEEGLGAKKAAVRKQQHGPVASGTLRMAQSIAAAEDATILFYAVGREKSYLWAIHEGRKSLSLLPGKAEISLHTRRYVTSLLKAADPIRESNVDGQWLYQRLVAPAEEVIGSRRRVFVITDGPLSGLNLEALLKPGPTGLHYWIDDVQITVASSVRMLGHGVARMRIGRDAHAQARTLLLIGNPVQVSDQYPALLHAGREIESVGRAVMPDRRALLTGADATPAAYLAVAPEKYSLIHFVAHGTASSTRPLDSAIVLSPPSGHPDGYKLYARDVMRQPIHAELVTISACYGSGLRNYADEGLVGLSWAFLRAGAHGVAGALWAVDDASTAELMSGMYQGLAAGDTPDAALREAKLKLLHSEGVYRKPLYWAGFQLYAGA